MDLIDLKNKNKNFVCPHSRGNAHMKLSEPPKTFIKQFMPLFYALLA